MLFVRRRPTLFLVVAFTLLLYAFYRFSNLPDLPNPHKSVFGPEKPPNAPGRPAFKADGRFHWATRKETYPLTSFIPMPSGRPEPIPRIQHTFGKETTGQRQVREERLKAVKETFERNWRGYEKVAWMKDELLPVTGGFKDTYGGWAATLVDSLDTLWIMGLKDEFEQAVEALERIDFTRSQKDVVSVFETTIRYLGGMLAAYDLSEGRYPMLLEKAVELGDMLYGAFDTPNRMPIVWWKWQEAKNGKGQTAGSNDPVACIGSLSLEFTRLSQLSKDPKFFDAIQRITNMFDKTQKQTKLPGMWPVMVDSSAQYLVGGSDFTFGALADSLYEYLPKEYLILGGRSQQYRRIYEDMIDVAKKHIFFRPLNPDNRDILVPGSATVWSADKVELNPEAQHLACFVGGMVGMGAKIFSRPDDLAIGRKLADGCAYYYERSPSGIMPESFMLIPCDDPTSSCLWDEKRYHKIFVNPDEEPAEAPAESYKTRASKKIAELHLSSGITRVNAPKYILRPEAIESVFYLYRITGDAALLEKAWNMFEAIEKHTKTQWGNAALIDVTLTSPQQEDSMESFWTAETLKYFYLIFSDPEHVSLDKFVFNTEAHPLMRPR